ncbi:hypothetical protein [Marinicrinis sediminis]|uniref:AMIN domain-containing protein n=1 Tax=Marinicrinis sediminis TaxID=1652465 RepID=A0ABW5R725_9BACL
MKRLKFWTFAGLLLLVVVGVSSGCANQKEPDPLQEARSSTIPSQVEPEKQTKPANTQTDNTKSEETDKKKHDAVISSPEQPDESVKKPANSPESDAGTDKPAPNPPASEPATSNNDKGTGGVIGSPEKPASATIEHYHPTQPRLMGLKIQESTDQAKAIYGNPLKTYTMGADASQLNVLEYPGFRIGADENNQIIFIEVSTSEAHPGLNGVALGDEVREMIRFYGEPSVQTEFVMNYISNGIVLKIDVDPVHQTISSIKLFADEESPSS